MNRHGPSNISGDDCDMTIKTPGLSPLPHPDFELDQMIPNVRRHWIIQVSEERIKVFIDGTLIADGAFPEAIRGVNRYIVQSTLFSYNTGKAYNSVRPTTSMLHWDNFGFTGPVSGPAWSTVTHNYIDGGPTGTTPVIGRGTVAHPIPGNRAMTRVNIPDQMGSPRGMARLKFTLQPVYGHGSYKWNSSHHILVNGKIYDFPDPMTTMQDGERADLISSDYIPHSTGIFVDPSDLRYGPNGAGINEIQLNLGGFSVLNLHIEIDYDRGNAPSYTQPKDVFGAAAFVDAVMPRMRPNDMYLFIEQDLGLSAAVDRGHGSSGHP
jgi:hypothetical protein